MIIPGQHYQHYKRGTKYEVVCLGTNEADMTSVVVYRSIDDEHVWVRPTADFLAEVTPGQPRFTLLPPA